MRVVEKKDYDDNDDDTGLGGATCLIRKATSWSGTAYAYVYGENYQQPPT